MSKHRNPRPNVSSTASLDNVNPGEASALAQAAGEVVTLLPSSAPAEMRRTLARLYALLTRISDEAGATPTLSEQLVSALSAHLAARTAARELERSSR